MCFTLLCDKKVVRSKHSLIFQIFCSGSGRELCSAKVLPPGKYALIMMKVWTYYILLLLSSPYQSHEASFLDPQCENLVHFLDILESPKTVILRTPSFSH